MLKAPPSGYVPCLCRDCMEIVRATDPAMCRECEDAGCPGDRECQASGAYGGEEELSCEGLSPEPVTAELIRGRCEHAGFCLVSAGTTEPALIIERLLVALGALDPDALDAFIQPEAAMLLVSNEAAADAAHPYWDSAEAHALIAALCVALNRAAPTGFFFASEGDETRLGFFRC